MSADSYGVRLSAVPVELLQVTVTFVNPQGAKHTAVGYGVSKAEAVANARQYAQAWLGLTTTCLAVSTPESILDDLAVTA